MLLELLAHLLLAGVQFCIEFVVDVVFELFVEAGKWAVGRAIRQFGMLQDE